MAGLPSFNFIDSAKLALLILELSMGVICSKLDGMVLVDRSLTANATVTHITHRKCGDARLSEFRKGVILECI